MIRTAVAVGLFAALTLGPTVTGRADDRPALAPVPESATPRDEDLSAGSLRRQIEDDWLRQARSWAAARSSGGSQVTTRDDAAGACDGLKDGKYGFHTGHSPHPWWQVDLGQPTPIGRIVVYNRLDYAPGLHLADRLTILTSDDGLKWNLVHDNQGRHFGGVHGAKPLELSFKPGEMQARFVRLAIPSEPPVYLHLDEVEIYGPDNPAKNLALNRPADQSSTSQWSTAKRRGFPTAEWIARGRRLAEELRALGVDVVRSLADLDAAAGRLAAIPENGADDARQAVYLETRWIVRRLLFSHPLLNFDKLLLVKRYTQETYPDVCLNHMPWVSRPGGDICVLSGPADTPTAGSGRGIRFQRVKSASGSDTLEAYPTASALFASLAEPEAADRPTARVRHVLAGALGPGHVHGMDLWWDADRVVFGYARTRTDQPPAGWLDRSQSYRLRREEEPIHLYEINLDGRGLRQLTRGEWSDLDPPYLPNGDVAFVSERCGTSLQCNEFDKDETSCNLYVMKSDGSRVRRLSVNKDGDYLPHCLDNGLIGYTRWEYHERSWAFIQSLWVVRPDGTWADAIFKQHFVNPWALEDVRSIPASNKLVAIAAGHHTLPAGPVVVVDHTRGINDPRGMGIVTPGVSPPEGGMDGVVVPEGGVTDCGGLYATPWALSERLFLTAYNYGAQTDPKGYGLYLIDVLGNKELLYRDPAIACCVPIPLRPRPRPPVLPDVTDEKVPYAVCTVNDVAYGCEGLDPKRIRYLRVAEPIGWPYDNTHGGQRYGEDHRYGGADAARRNLTNWTPIRIFGTVPVEADGSVHFRVPADTAVYFQLLDENQQELRRMRSFLSFQPGEVRGCVGCHESRTVAPTAKPLGVATVRPPANLVPPPWGDRPISFLRDVQPVLDRHCVECHTGLKPGGEIDLSAGLISFDPAIPGYGHNRAFETILAKNLVSLSPARAQDASITPPLAYGSLKSKLLTCLDQGTHAGRVKLTADDRLRLVTWIDANAPYHDRFVNKRSDQPAYDLAADQDLLKRLTAIHARRCASCHAPTAVTRLDWIDLHHPDRTLFLLAPLPAPAGQPTKCRGTYRDPRDPDYQAALTLVRKSVARQWAEPRRDVIALKESGEVQPPLAREGRSPRQASRGGTAGLPSPNGISFPYPAVVRQMPSDRSGR